MKIIALVALLLASVNSHAEITAEREAADCLKINSYAASGDTFYKLKKYPQAREQYEQQAAWSETCQLGKSRIATAYNNVALTYIRQTDYLRANAWLNILPNDKKSVFNMAKISNEIKKSIGRLANKPDGKYWQYAGKSLWSVISIKKENAKYRFDFDGYYAGLMAMYSGPNMGDFSTTLDMKNGKALYSMLKDGQDFDCVYEFTVTNETLTVERVSGDSCGFGYNVSAEGVYYKVAS